MVDRILRAIRLDSSLYREVAEDESSMPQAAIIVLIVTLMSAIGAFIGALITDVGFGRAVLGFFVEFLVSGILIGWIGWAALTFFVGTTLFKGKTDIPEMMRVLGFASAPRLLGFFGFIPCVGWLIALVGWILALVAGVIAIREAMEFETGNAIITVVISWVIAFVITLILGAILGVGSAALSGAFG